MCEEWVVEGTKRTITNKSLPDFLKITQKGHKRRMMSSAASPIEIR